MAFKVLIMGLLESGKTTLANNLTVQLKSKGKSIIRLNANEQRKKYQDWDFSMETCEQSFKYSIYVLLNT